MGLPCASNCALFARRNRLAKSYLENCGWSCGDLRLERVHEAYFAESATTRLPRCGKPWFESTQKVF